MPSASRWPCCGGIFYFDTAPARLAELNRRAEDPGLWSDPPAAQKVMRQRQALERSTAEFLRLQRELDTQHGMMPNGDSKAMRGYRLFAGTRPEVESVTRRRDSP